MRSFKVNKILVCYLLTKFDNKKTLLNFIYNYKKNNSGLKHNLLICFKLLNSIQINSFKNILSNIEYIDYIDNSKLNDYDLGSYMRVAQKYPSSIIFFLNSHSYPIRKNWLKKMLSHYKNKTLIGTTASNESLLTSLRLKRFYKFFSYFYKLLKYKKKFNPFPNPHIRTSGFLIKGSDYISFIKNKKITNKEDAWSVESGINGLTNYFKRKKYNIFIINSDGLKFTESSWKLSETYNYLKQSKSLISDKHTRKYLKLSLSKRLIASYNSWGS
jgi:hypothetical protein